MQSIAARPRRMYYIGAVTITGGYHPGPGRAMQHVCVWLTLPQCSGSSHRDVPYLPVFVRRSADSCLSFAMLANGISGPSNVQARARVDLPLESLRSPCTPALSRQPPCHCGFAASASAGSFTEPPCNICMRSAGLKELPCQRSSVSRLGPSFPLLQRHPVTNRMAARLRRLTAGVCLGAPGEC